MKGDTEAAASRAVPFSEAGGWTDDVARMNAIIGRLKGRVPDFQWAPPPIGTTGHMLTWTESGKPRQHTEELLGALCTWADDKWPE